MNIYSEFEKLKQVASTEAGWQALDRAWMIASNYQLRDGNWVQIGGSGYGVIGFAIDPVTKRFKLGTNGLESHKNAYFILLNELQHESHSLEEFHDIERRLLEGRLARVDGYAYPLATIVDALEWHREDSKFLPSVEDQLLTLGIGLPLSGLIIAKALRKKV